MALKKAPKKRLVTSMQNLPIELQEKVHEKYPLGYTDVMMRIDKPNGDFFYAVPFETEEIDYLIKITVKVDEKGNLDDKDIFDNEIKGAEDIASDDEDEDETPRTKRSSITNVYDDDDDSME